MTISQGIETATFHILTPYPSTPSQGRLPRLPRFLSLGSHRARRTHRAERQRVDVAMSATSPLSLKVL